jgi:hypothetical protein
VPNTSPSGLYPRTWSPIAAALLLDGSHAVVVRTSFWDEGSLLPWIWHVSPDGELLRAEQLAEQDEISAVAATAEGFLLLGKEGIIGPAIARRYDLSLTVLGDLDVSATLSGTPAAMHAGATRDGATVLVGQFHPALPASAAKVMLLGRTHLPPTP